MIDPELPAEAAASGTADRKPLNRTVLAAGAGLVFGAMLGIAGTMITTSAVAGSHAQAQAAAEVQAREADAAAEAAKTRPLKAALDTCGISSRRSAAKLGDNDKSLQLDGGGEEDRAGLHWENVYCVLDAVKIPDSVRGQIGRTRALDGTMRESWGNISATWTYHPDAGLDIGLTEK